MRKRMAPATDCDQKNSGIAGNLSEPESRPKLSCHDQLGPWTFAELAASTYREGVRTFLQPLNRERRFAHRSNFFPGRRLTPVIDSLIDTVTGDALFGWIRVPD